MGTEILRPQDCFSHRIRVSPCRRRSYFHSNTSNDSSFNPNPRFNRKTVLRSEKTADQRKHHHHHHHHQTVISKRSNSVDENKSNGFDKITILRRGESLDSVIKSSEQPPVTGLASPMAVKSDVYAGSGFVVSPAPSSLPLPSFSKKKQALVDDLATRDLRRLLRLDF